MTTTSDKAVRMAIGVRISMLRKNLGWNQGQLVEATGISSSTISRVEKGHQFLTLPGIFRMAAVLGVEPAQLLPDLEDLKNAGYDRKDMGT